jgi:ankyrin repeat protein
MFDFQSQNNFPEGERATPFALINIPLEDEIINPYSKAPIGTLKQVRNAAQAEIWNPASHWLWSQVCGGGIRDELATTLINAGADPNFTAAPGEDSTFNCALRGRSLKQIRLFARHGANPNVKSRANRIHYPHPNAMFLVMHRYIELDGKLSIFKILIKQGVDLNARHKDGETLLHRVVADAYLKDREPITRFLLAAGVNARVERHDGMTALDLAQSRRDKLINAPKKSKQEQQDLSDLNKIIELLGRG